MIFATDLTLRLHELAPEVEARGFESLWVTEKTHVPISRRTPWPGGELPEWYKRTCDHAFRDTAAYGDGWLPIESYGTVLPHLDRLRNAFADAERDPDTAVVSVFSSAGDPDTIASYEQASIDRVVVWLPPAERDTVLRALDCHSRRLQHWLDPEPLTAGQSS